MTIELIRDEIAIDLSVLRRRLQGLLITPAAPGYDQARRVVNHRYDSYPVAIVCPEGARDVAEAVRFAREHGLEIAVRSGGHSVPGHSTGDGVLLIDLSHLKHIDVDPVRRTARVQPGVTNGELVLTLQQHGLATTTGTCATVGMGGSTLGGGIGWLMGRFGMTIDNLLACEIVTAEGQVLNASAEEHPDLFWALRGGGGNFGIVTAFTYQLHPIGPVLGGPLIFPLAAAPLVLRMFRHLTSTAPDELLAHAVLSAIPNFGPAIIFQAVYSGEDLAVGERLLDPIRRFGPPAVDMIAARSYAETYMMLTPPLGPSISYVDTAYTLRQPTDAALDALIDTAMEIPPPIGLVELHQFHGAATRVAPDATAFALREAHYPVLNAAAWMEGDGAPQRAWAAKVAQQMAPHASRGLYVNFLGDEGADAVRDAYRANYRRLEAIKSVYDPENIFRRNQNIQPAAR